MFKDKEAREDIESIKMAIGFKSYKDILNIKYFKSKKLLDVETKLNYLFEYLGIKFQETCTENLPKIVKVKKNKK